MSDDDGFGDGASDPERPRLPRASGCGTDAIGYHPRSSDRRRMSAMRKLEGSSSSEADGRTSFDYRIAPDTDEVLTEIGHVYGPPRSVVESDSRSFSSDVEILGERGTAFSCERRSFTERLSTSSISKGRISGLSFGERLSCDSSSRPDSRNHVRTTRWKTVGRVLHGGGRDRDTCRAEISETLEDDLLSVERTQDERTSIGSIRSTAASIWRGSRRRLRVRDKSTIISNESDVEADSSCEECGSDVLRSTFGGLAGHSKESRPGSASAEASSGKPNAVSELEFNSFDSAAMDWDPGNGAASSKDSRQTTYLVLAARLSQDRLAKEVAKRTKDTASSLSCSACCSRPSSRTGTKVSFDGSAADLSNFDKNISSSGTAEDLHLPDSRLVSQLSGRSTTPGTTERFTDGVFFRATPSTLSRPSSNAGHHLSGLRPSSASVFRCPDYQVTSPFSTGGGLFTDLPLVHATNSNSSRATAPIDGQDCLQPRISIETIDSQCPTPRSEEADGAGLAEDTACSSTAVGSAVKAVREKTRRMTDSASTSSIKAGIPGMSFESQQSDRMQATRIPTRPSDPAPKSGGFSRRKWQTDSQGSLGGMSC